MQPNKNNKGDKLLGILQASKGRPLRRDTLAQLAGISLWEFDPLVSELRNTHPIVSKKGRGGGYWIATRPDEVRKFNTMLGGYASTHLQTIHKMEKLAMEMENE